MIACVDVHYRDTRAVAAGIAFRGWLDESVVAEQVITVPDIQPYNPGKFFVRELPCLLAVLEKLPPAEIVLIDGYVWLEKNRPGLGAHLYTSLESRIPVIGCKKLSEARASNLYISARLDSVRWKHPSMCVQWASRTASPRC